MNISKELLSEVLGYAVSSIYIAPNGNFIEAQSKYRDERINIYELQHKCKEWAFKQGYELFSRILSNDHKPVGNCVVYRVEADPEESLKITNADTEPESVIKATQWILDNKDKQ